MEERGSEAAMRRRCQQPQPQRHWEAALLAAYEDYRWRQVLEPLAVALQQWRAGARSHWEIAQVLHETHRETQRLSSFFSQSRTWLVRLAQLAGAWFAAWVADQPPPPGALVDPPVGQGSIPDQDADNGQM